MNLWAFEPLKIEGFDIIYADPAFDFETRTPDGAGRSPSKHYDTMTVGEIMSLPVGALAKRNAVLFFWYNRSLIPECVSVVKTWGFRVSSVAFTWVKTTKDGTRTRMGLGYGTRAETEQCWLCVKGAGLKRQRADVREVIFAPPREHSRKPDAAAARITMLFGDLPRVELFSRNAKSGWSHWGKEKGKFR